MTTATADAVFSARDVPWMKIGTVLEEQDVTAAEAAHLAGMDFTVSLQPAAYLANGEWVQQDDRKAIVRDDTSDFYGFCSNDYVPVQYADAFSFMDEINPRYVAAGTMNQGRQGFMVVKLPEHSALDLSLAGGTDPHELYVIMRTAHDRSKGIEIVVTTLRHKCMNQLTLPSLSADAPQRWTVRHVGDPTSKLAQAQSVLANTEKYEQSYRSVARRLAEVPVASDEAQMALERLLPERPRRDDTQIPSILGSFKESETVSFHGTAWGLVNAVSEYFEWGRGFARRTDESRFKDNLDGATHQHAARVAQFFLRR